MHEADVGWHRAKAEQHAAEVVRASGARRRSRLSRTDVYYLFAPQSAAHIQFYLAWVEVARRHGLPAVLLTVLPDSISQAGRDRILAYANFPYVRLLRAGRLLRPRLRLFLFLLGRLIRGRRIIIQVHKGATSPLDWLKRLVGRRVQYAITLEGDVSAELEYLRAHPYREGFYAADLLQGPVRERELEQHLKRADHILPVTVELRAALIRRYPELDLSERTTVLPTGFDQRNRFYSQDLREQTRQALGIATKFVMTYIGNVHYSWQNFGRTVEIYQLIRGHCPRPTFFLLLVRQQDHPIVRDFLERYEVPEDEVLVRHVSNEELTAYLNAADLGVVLRHDHPMNRAAGVPGKLGDYAGAGLPVLVNRGVPGWQAIERIGGGAVLQDMDDDQEVLRLTLPLTEEDTARRRRLEKWAREHLSAEAHAEAYQRFLRRMVNRAWEDERA